jgi:hypothetical protein
MTDGAMPTLPEPPDSRRTSRRWVLPLAVVAALLVGLVIGYVAGDQAAERGDIESTETAGGAETVTITEQPVPTGPISQSGTTGTTGTTGATGAAAEPESSLDSPFPKGQPGEAFGWTVKVADFNPDADDVVEQANEFNAPARRGVYAVVTVRFGRTEGQSEDPWANMTAALVVRGQTYPESDEACCLPDDWTDIGKIPTGGSAVGRIAFDVPKAGLDTAVLFLTITDSETFDEAEGFFAVN